MNKNPLKLHEEAAPEWNDSWILVDQLSVVVAAVLMEQNFVVFSAGGRTETSRKCQNECDKSLKLGCKCEMSLSPLLLGEPYNQKSLVCVNSQSLLERKSILIACSVSEKCCHYSKHS